MLDQLHSSGSPHLSAAAGGLAAREPGGKGGPLSSTSICLPAPNCRIYLWLHLEEPTGDKANQGSLRRLTVSNCLCHLWLQLEETRQREDIQKAKQDRDAMLAGKAANIARIRRIAHAQAAVRRHQAQERQAARAVQVGCVKAPLDERASSAAHCACLQCCSHPLGLQLSSGSAQTPRPG